MNKKLLIEKISLAVKRALNETDNFNIEDGYDNYYHNDAWNERCWSYYMNKFIYPDDDFDDDDFDDDEQDVYDDDLITLVQLINAYLWKYKGFKHLNKNEMSKYDWQDFNSICQDFADCYPEYWQEINSDCHFDEILNSSSVNEAWGDNFDRSHNAPASKQKKAITKHYTTFGIPSLYSPSTRKGFMDIHVIKNTNPKYASKSFGINVVEHKSTKTDNFRIQIPRTGETVFTDANVSYIAFIAEDNYMGNYYNVYVVKKSDILSVYNKLTKLYDKCKLEVKQKLRDKKTLNAHALTDKYNNFLAPGRGGDGLSVTVEFLEEKAVEIFRAVV